MLPVVRYQLLEQATDRSEYRAERAADTVDASHDRDAEAGRYDAIFNGSRTAFIVEKSCQQSAH
jgi:hypothetical protein